MSCEYLGYSYTKKFLVVYLKFRFNWVFCILSGNLVGGLPCTRCHSTFSHSTLIQPREGEIIELYCLHCTDEKKNTLEGNLICLMYHNSEKVHGAWNLKLLTISWRAAFPTLLLMGKGLAGRGGAVAGPSCGGSYIVMVREGGSEERDWSYSWAQAHGSSPPGFSWATLSRGQDSPQHLPPQFIRNASAPIWCRVMCGMPACYMNNYHNNNNNAVTTKTRANMWQALW